MPHDVAMTSVRPLVLAHRGDHRAATENSLAAFRAALALPGCDGLEFDVRLSADGVPVVIHDETLERTHGRRLRVAALTADALDDLGVPSLRAVLEIAGPAPFLDVELKEDVAGPVVAALREARGPDGGRTAVSSFDAEALAHLGRVARGWRCWLNVDDLGGDTIGLAAELGCAGIAARWESVDTRAVARARVAGLEVAAWTVTRTDTFERVARLGVIAVCVEGRALPRLSGGSPPDARGMSGRPGTA